jgi:hypothetical protein
MYQPLLHVKRKNSMKPQRIVVTPAIFSHPNTFQETPSMDEKIAQEILDELFSSLEKLDTRSSAILQFLKDNGIAKEEDLAPYMEQAGNASSVRWLAARVRIDHLLGAAIKSTEEKAKPEASKTAGETKTAEKATEENREAHRGDKESRSPESKENDEGTEQAAATGKTPSAKTEDDSLKAPKQEEKQSQQKPEDNAA